MAKRRAPYSVKAVAAKYAFLKQTFFILQKMILIKLKKNRFKKKVYESDKLMT